MRLDRSWEASHDFAGDRPHLFQSPCCARRTRFDRRRFRARTSPREPRASNMPVGVLAARLVTEFSIKADEPEWDGVDEAVRGADQPILSGLRYILSRALWAKANTAGWSGGDHPAAVGPARPFHRTLPRLKRRGSTPRLADGGVPRDIGPSPASRGEGGSLAPAPPLHHICGARAGRPGRRADLAARRNSRARRAAGRHDRRLPPVHCARQGERRLFRLRHRPRAIARRRRSASRSSSSRRAGPISPGISKRAPSTSRWAAFR